MIVAAGEMAADLAGQRRLGDPVASRYVPQRASGYDCVLDRVAVRPDTDSAASRHAGSLLNGPDCVCLSASRNAPGPLDPAPRSGCRAV